MEYVVKELAVLLKEKGFNGYTTWYYTKGGELDLNGECGCLPYNEMTNLSDEFKNRLLCAAPCSEDVVLWIFNKLDEFAEKYCDDDSYLWHISLEWLHFWYTKILEHDFPLMGEVVSRLKKWFMDNNVVIIPLHLTNKRFVYEIRNSDSILLSKVIERDDNQMAEHDTIMECFKLSGITIDTNSEQLMI